MTKWPESTVLQSLFFENEKRTSGMSCEEGWRRTGFGGGGHRYFPNVRRSWDEIVMVWAIPTGLEQNLCEQAVNL